MVIGVPKVTIVIVDDTLEETVISLNYTKYWTKHMRNKYYTQILIKNHSIKKIVSSKPVLLKDTVFS